MRRSGRFLQDQSLVRELDRLLRRHVSEVRDYTWAFHRRWERKGVTLIRGAGWAVRPFVLPIARMHFIAAAFHNALSALRSAILAASKKRGAVTRLLPVHPEFEDCFDVAGGAASPAFLSHFRPDGFLFEDGFVLSEINYGNGIVISCGYTDPVADYWRNHPLIKRLGWDVDRMHCRPLPWYINVARRFARPVANPVIALLSQSEEWQTMLGYPRRTQDQLRLVCREMEKAGMQPRTVTENDVSVDKRGNLRFDSDGRKVDLLMFITVGSTFLDRPELLRKGGPLHHLTRPRIGDTWVLKPLSGLMVDKGALPLLGRLDGSRKMQDGFRFEIPHTEYPIDAGAPRYLRRRANWVIKRSFDGKDTSVGATSTPAAWRNAVEYAAGGYDYVAQRYVQIPRAEIPVFLDEKHLEWVPSRCELSPFIYDGAFGGAGVRHAPDAEGVVMTDFPEGYGYTIALAV